MDGPRSPNPQEFNTVLTFLNQNLRPKATWSIESEYPTAFSHTNLHNVRILVDEGRVISHAVIRPIIIKTPCAIYKVATLGSVVTDGEHRGDGHSTAIIEACLGEAARQECDLAILWTDLADFYRRFGFELTGYELSCVVDEKFQPATVPQNLRFLHGVQVSTESLLRVYSTHTVGSVRTLEEMRKYLSIPNTKVHTAWSAEGLLVAYAIEGKGADFTDYIHEWGGGVNELTALFAQIRKVKNKPVTVIFPLHSLNLMAALEKGGCTVREGYLGMLKILNPNTFLKKIERALHHMKAPQFQFRRDGERFELNFGSHQLVCANERELLKVIFGQHTNPLPATFSQYFPLPLWLWGWDSI